MFFFYQSRSIGFEEEKTRSVINQEQLGRKKAYRLTQLLTIISWCNSKTVTPKIRGMGGKAATSVAGLTTLYVFFKCVTAFVPLGVILSSFLFFISLFFSYIFGPLRVQRIFDPFIIIICHRVFGYVIFFFYFSINFK